MILNQAINDLRACRLLATMIGKQAVIDMIDENLNQELTFSKYPKFDYWLHSTRNKINRFLNNVYNEEKQALYKNLRLRYSVISSAKKVLKLLPFKYLFYI